MVAAASQGSNPAMRQTALLAVLAQHKQLHTTVHTHYYYSVTAMTPQHSQHSTQPVK
eukprot:COSAG01_NODE_6057_length_3876_cov_2.004766_3_plen_57_part_00